jgi:hypothetical protein
LALVAEKMEGSESEIIQEAVDEVEEKRTNIFTTPPDGLGNYG